MNDKSRLTTEACLVSTVIQVNINIQANRPRTPLDLGKGTG